MDGRRVGQGGAGPGAHTPDGSAVELYELAPVSGEDEVINAAIEPGSSILELTEYLTPDKTWVRAQLS